MAAKISDIKGIEASAQEALASQGITTTQQLLDRVKTPQERNSLARQTGIASSQLGELINRADLMQLKGVGTEMSNLLEECGVDSIKELRHRKAENLHAAMKQANEEKKIAYRAPSLAQVEGWIAQSKEMTAASA